VCICQIAWASNDSPRPSKSPSGLFGYVDDAGKFVIKPQFEEALPFQNGVARVRLNTQWRTINEKGKFLSKNAYSEIREFKNGIALVGQKEPDSQRTLLGLLTERGSEILMPQYTYITPEPNYTLFIVGKAGPLHKDGTSKVDFGVVNNEGETIIPIQFLAVRHFNFRVFTVKNETLQWQAFDAIGKPIFPGLYADMKDFDEDLATVKVSGKWGILTRAGELVVKANYRDIIKKTKNNYELMGFTQWKVFNQKKEIVLSMEYEDVQPVHQSLYSYQLEGKKGLLNEKGEKISEPQFEQIFSFSKDMAVVKNGPTYGVIYTKGTVILPAKFQSIVIDTATSLIRAKDSGKWGVYNKAGKIVVPVQYEDVRIQPYGLFTVRQENQWKLLNSAGQFVGNQSFDSLGNYQHLHFVARKGAKMGVITLNGVWALEPTYDSLRIISEYLVHYQNEGESGLINIHTRKLLLTIDTVEPLRNYFRVVQKGKVGVINYQGREVVPIQYDYISDFTSDSVLTVVQGRKRGLMNLQGKVILKPDPLYQELFVMDEKRVGVKINNKYGFVDINGKLRIANRYEGIGPFSSDMAAVMIQGNWGYIDKPEMLRVQPRYQEAKPFIKGTAQVKRFGKWGFVDKTGRETVKTQFDSIRVLSTGRYMTFKNGQKGLVNEAGKEIFGPKYDYLSDYANTFVLLGRNGKLGLSDINGFDVLPVIYDRLYFNASKNFYITGVESYTQKFTYTR
jgi:hypothetical protein